MFELPRQPQSTLSPRKANPGILRRTLRRPFYDLWDSFSSTSSSESPSPALSSTENATIPSTSPSSLSDDEEIARIDGMYISFSSGDRDTSLTMSQDNLRQQIHNELQSVAVDQCYDMAFRFAGQRKNNLRFALVITTMTREAQRLIHGHLLKLLWLSKARKENKLDIHVLLADFGPASGPQSDDEYEQVPEHPYLMIPSQSESLCGSKIMLPSSYRHPASYCTFGAVLQFGDRLRGLGPWHALGTLGYPMPKDATTLGRHGEMSATEDCHLPLSLYHDDDDDEGIWSDSLSSSSGQHSLLEQPGCSSSLQNDSFVDKTSYMSDVDPRAGYQTCTIKLDHNDPSHAGPKADWHTFDLDAETIGSTLNGLMCNKVDGSFITDIYDPTPGINVPVTIAAPKGEIRGTLRSDSTLYTMGPHTYDLAIVTMDRPLHRGCSGALVTRGNQLCGIVLVVSETVPWAYIMPARTMLTDMEAVSGLKVSLPEPDVPCVRDAEARGTSPVPHFFSKGNAKNYDVRDQFEHSFVWKDGWRIDIRDSIASLNDLSVDIDVLHELCCQAFNDLLKRFRHDHDAPILVVSLQWLVLDIAFRLLGCQEKVFKNLARLQSEYASLLSLMSAFAMTVGFSISFGSLSLAPSSKIVDRPAIHNPLDEDRLGDADLASTAFLKRMGFNCSQVMLVHDEAQHFVCFCCPKQRLKNSKFIISHKEDAADKARVTFLSWARLDRTKNVLLLKRSEIEAWDTTRLFTDLEPSSLEILAPVFSMVNRYNKSLDALPISLRDVECWREAFRSHYPNFLVFDDHGYGESKGLGDRRKSRKSQPRLIKRLRAAAEEPNSSKNAAEVMAWMDEVENDANPGGGASTCTCQRCPQCKPHHD